MGSGVEELLTVMGLTAVMGIILGARHENRIKRSTTGGSTGMSGHKKRNIVTRSARLNALGVSSK